MINVPTAHISAKKKDIAETVLMPGDPLRAKYIADTFLTGTVCVNEVRGMLGFTGFYKGNRVSIFGSGMGMPSIGIYSYELFNFYDVHNIIRIGSAGSIKDNIKIRSIVAGMGACTDSNYISQYGLPGLFAPIADFNLLNKAIVSANEKGIGLAVGNILSSDVFYCEDHEVMSKWANMGVLAVEMEAAALYINAASSGKNALCLVTISDSLITGESLSSIERQKTFGEMAELALSLV